jgi:hypothetical protein
MTTNSICEYVPMSSSSQTLVSEPFYTLKMENLKELLFMLTVNVCLLKIKTKKFLKYQIKSKPIVW